MSLPLGVGGRRRKLLGWLIAIGFGQAAVAGGTAYLMRFGFDHLVRRSHHPTVWLFLAVAAGLLAGAAATGWLRIQERTHASRLGQDFVAEMRMHLFDRLSTLAPRALQMRSRGGIMLRFMGDLTALRQWITQGLARLWVAAIATAGAVSALAFINWLLALTVALVLAGGALLSVVMAARVRRSVEEARRQRSTLAANVNEKIASIAVVQVFGQSVRERAQFDQQSRSLAQAMVARARITGVLRAISEAVSAAATGAVLVVGAAEVTMGHASAGTVVAAMSIVGHLAPPLRDLGRIHEYWHGAAVARGKIQEFLDMPSLVSEAADALPLRAGPGRIEFRGVQLVPDRCGVEAVAEPGEVVAIVGSNGAGKSTLLALAARLVDPAAGAVLIDGQDVSRATLASVRRVVGMVSPDLPLLRGTIGENLRYRSPDAPRAEIERVSALCAVDEILARLPAGAATPLAEGAANLSFGERQRIALARALVGNPRILLLDEADANLDPKASGVLDAVLAAYRGTVLMVTHRLRRAAAADTVWCLEDGVLVESGPAASLASGKGPTGQLFARALARAS